MKPLLFETVTIVALIAYFVPLLLVVSKRLFHESFFVLFAGYWCVEGILNLCDKLPFVSKDLYYNISVVYNMIDLPGMLIIIYCTSTTRRVKNIIPFATAALICIELYGLYYFGFSADSMKYAIGIGLAAVILALLMEIASFAHLVNHSNRQTARMFIYGAVLFEYASYIVIYLFEYYSDFHGTSDTYLVYYFSALGAIVIASCGFFMYRRERLKIKD